jgi:hypothetical protein
MSDIGWTGLIESVADSFEGELSITRIEGHGDRVQLWLLDRVTTRGLKTSFPSNACAVQTRHELERLAVTCLGLPQPRPRLSPSRGR